MYLIRYLLLLGLGRIVETFDQIFAVYPFTLVGKDS